MERHDARTGKRLPTSRASRQDIQAASDSRPQRSTSSHPSAPTSHPSVTSPGLDLPTLRLPALHTPPAQPAMPASPDMVLIPARRAPRSRALAARQPADGDAPLVVPPTPTRRLSAVTTTTPAPIPNGRIFRWSRPATFGLTAVALIVALAFGAHEAQGTGNTPGPSGSAPWYAFAASAAVATVPPPPPAAVRQQQVAVAGQASPLEPCQAKIGRAHV